MGDIDWTRATLGASEHVAQVHRELKCRQPPGPGQSKAMRAELQRFVTWEYYGEAA